MVTFEFGVEENCRCARDDRAQDTGNEARQKVLPCSSIQVRNLSIRSVLDHVAGRRTGRRTTP